VLFYSISPVKCRFWWRELSRGVLSEGPCVVSRRSEECHRRTGRSSLVCVSGSGGAGVCSVCCRKISEMMLEDGAPNARPSVWVTVVSL
jgi:hypothetical protein